jgi:hypothetical protein
VSMPGANPVGDDRPCECDDWLAANLSQISTRWPMISDPVRFVFRYADPIHRYLAAIIKNPHDAEEVLQDFLLRAFQHGFVPEQVAHGKFRNYLKAAVRNAAISHFRRKASTNRDSLDGRADRLVDPAADVGDDANERWLQPWRQCLLDRAWQALDHHQRSEPDNLACTVLRLIVDHPDEDSTALAARASQIAGRTVRASSFRKHLSRARRTFARLIIEEVARTLERPTPEAVEDELVEMGLMPYLRPLLPPDWREMLPPQ